MTQFIWKLYGKSLSQFSLDLLTGLLWKDLEHYMFSVYTTVRLLGDFGPQSVGPLIGLGDSFSIAGFKYE